LFCGADYVSREVGVSVDALERWRAEALITPARERAWSAAARFDAVVLTQPFLHRSRTKVPILSGLPFGHAPTQVSLPVGQRVTLAVQGRDAFVGR
jgi:hypothetical protein